MAELTKWLQNTITGIETVVDDKSFVCDEIVFKIDVVKNVLTAFKVALVSLEVLMILCRSAMLSELNHFINRHADNTKYLKVWGNGATFDNVILRGAYERAGQICPWAYWNDHDVRTIVTLGRSIGFDPKMDMPFDGERHNALADARHQAKYVSAIWQKLIPATSTEL